MPTIRTYFPTPTTRALSKQPYVFQDPEKCKDLIAVTSSDTWLLGYAEHNAQFFPHLNTLHWYDSVNLNLIRTHGFKIKTIDLESTEWADVAPYLEYLPNVQRVIIDIQATNNYIYAALTRGQVELVVCTTVKVVGVTAYSKQPPRKQYNALFMSLPDIFPALERIRILENSSALA
ncbi:hypothetical protein FRC17_008033 [Serendipita sp. 399]|nr:hypothetical protein FRC17_008033 [Serendipita sp. 399]